MGTKIMLNETDCQLNSSLFFTISKLSRSFKNKGDEIFHKTGLSPSHAFILYVLHIKGTVPQKDMGNFLHLSPSTMTRFIQKLETKNYLEKTSEGKNVYLHLSDHGKKHLPLIIDAWNEINTLISTALTEEERNTYMQLSQKLLTHLGCDTTSI